MKNQSLNFRSFRIATVFFLTAFITTLANADGRDGNVGSMGESGKNGRSGRASINWVPRDPNPEWFFYFPIKNGDIEAFKHVLAGGAKVNWPMTNIIGRPTAFEIAMETRWYDGLRLMFENQDLRNRPDVRDTTVRNRNNSRMNIYEFLTFGEAIDEHGNLAPNFAVRSEDLEILKLALNASDNFDDLNYNTQKIRPALVSVVNKFHSFPNNIEAVRAIENRLAELKLKN